MKIIDGDYTLSVDSRWNMDLIEVKRRRRRSLIRRRYVETMIVADDTMFKSFGGNEIELRSYLLSMMAIVCIYLCRSVFFLAYIFYQHSPPIPGIRAFIV